ncbi:MAG TPA: histidine phosphatase family protein [Acidimicrobiales bacterium]|nr:histidine phosphatase family protein [Acidimicrobiales bacterium]
MDSGARWPAGLWLVRHGESCGNVARDAAEASGHELIDIAERDMDVELSPLGRRQADALGQWLGDRPEHDQPTVALASPYVRAVQTACIALEAAGCSGEVVRDERLREREFGVLDRLTKAGIEQRFPAEAEARRRLGKFYHRPAGGESWGDVALRVRSVLDSIGREYPGERVLVVAHQVVILLFRYVLEHLSEQDLLAIDREQELANCGVTEFRLQDDAMVLHRFNDAEPVAAAGEAVTAESDTAVAPR